MSAQHPFTDAFASMDPDAMSAAFSSDVVFHSPVLATVGSEVTGREIAVEALGLVFQRIGPPKNVTEFEGRDGRYVMKFDAAIEGHKLEALVLLTEDAEGKVSSIAPHLRPYPVVGLLREFMMARMCPDPLPEALWSLPDRTQLPG